MFGKPLLLATSTISVACGGMLTDLLVPAPVGNIVPPPPKICVQTDPADAVVTLNGQVAGAACTQISVELVPVSVQVEVSAPAYVTHRETVVMSSYREELVVMLEAVDAAPPPPVGNLIAPPEPIVLDAAAGDCADLLVLEAPSMLGKLSGPQKGCLEALLPITSAPARRAQISRLLMQDAKSRGDMGAWARLMERHLREVSPEDPEACLRYAIYRHRADDGGEEEVIALADCVLEHHQQWEGGDGARHLGLAHKVRARAAERRWERAVQVGAPEGDVRQHRAVAEACARDWLAHAREAGAPIDEPLALCIAVAEDVAICQD